jgi:PKHD-type hydroxylase
MREHGVVLVRTLEPDVCNQIIGLHKTGTRVSGRINSETGPRVDAMREVDVYPLQDWTSGLISDLADEANEILGYDIEGLVELPQLLHYRAPSAQYEWHTDMGEGPARNRKISLICNLNEGYKGGEFWAFLSGPQSIELKRGMVIAFPSWMPHRIARVAHGERWSLVAWINGPELR